MRVLTVAISVLLVWALPSAVAQAATPESAPAAAASAVTKKKALKKAAARKKALKKCRKIGKKVRRQRCIRKARKRFAKKPAKPVKPKPRKTWRVDVLDDYFVDQFSPDYLEIKAGDRINWVWSDLNQNPHNVTLESGPAGINRQDYMTPNAPSRNYSWTRQLDKTGKWVFVCSLHHLMRLTVKVGK